jgi:glycosyltransferase involved in cell wall biosynthesis
MRVAIISKASQLGGGGSKVATTLAKLLRENDHFCHHFRRDLENGYKTNESNIFGVKEKLFKWINYRLRYLGFHEVVPWEYYYLKSEMIRLKIDVIHVHDISTALSPITIGKLASHFPVVWTMHDFSPFSGGCIQPLGCERYKLSCGSCPQSNVWPLGGLLDLTALNLKLKRWLHKKFIYFVSPSHFLKNHACMAGIEEKKIAVIHNSVDTAVFRPKDKKKAKASFGLHHDKFIILLIASDLNSPYKGTGDAINLLNKIAEPFQVLVVGRISSDERNLFAGIDSVFAGYINDLEQLNECYNASDIFLNCSKADNFPLVVLESLSAGTPVYGYATGGIVEMVENGKTGELVESGDWLRLTKIINQRILMGENNESQRCHESVLSSYTDEVFLSKTLAVYHELLDKFQ